jgi:hypothetical protein
MGNPKEWMTNFAKNNPRLAGALTKPADLAADAMDKVATGAKKLGGAVLDAVDTTPVSTAITKAVMGKKKKIIGDE